MVFCQTRAPNPAVADSMSEMPQVLAAPLFIEAAGFTSTITMVSELNFAVTAQVVLFDRNGAQITSQTVSFPAHSRQTVLVGDWLHQANSAETMGSVEVLPDPAKVVTMAIAAQLSITGSGASIGQHIEEEFLMAGMSGSGVLRSAGASLVSKPIVALRNTAAAAQTATISCITEKGAATRQQVKLAAGGWALLQACTSSSNAAVSLIGDALASPAQAAPDPGAFGVSVAGTGKPGSLAAFGFSWHGAARGAMLSSQNFVDAGTFHSGNTVFTGVPVGAATYLPGAFFTPQVALANFGAKPVNATVLFSRTTGSGPEPSNVAAVSVPAMSSQTIALPVLTGDPGLRNSFIVQSDAAPGTLFASVAAVGAPGFGLVEQIGKDEQTTANGGGHPWDLTGGQDAVLLLFNHSAVAKYFNVKIGSGGVLWQQPYLLAPMETRAISIRELIAGQIKDQDGKLLPQSLESGEIGWFNANPAEGKGRLMQIDPASQTVAANTRVARNFSCSYTYVLCGASISPDSVTINDGGSSGSLQVIPAVCLSVTPSNCFGQSSSYGGMGYTYEWTVNGPAEVSGSSTESTATLQGTGAGTGYVYCRIASNYNNSNCQENPFATLNVCSVTVNSVLPYSDKISTTLAGPSGGTGQESIWEATSSADNYSLTMVTRGSGTYGNDPFMLTSSSPTAQYNTLYAAWNACTTNIITSNNHSFYNWGNTLHTQYAVIWESTCTAATSTAYIITNLGSCFSNGLVTTTLSTQFESQASLNGIGQSLHYGLLKALAATSCSRATAGKPAGANNGNTFVEVTSFTGSCNTTLSSSTVAQYSPQGTSVNCGQQEFIYHYPSSPGTLKTVQDRCPACSNSPGSAHFDDFNPSQGAPNCGIGGGMPSLGNHVTLTDGILNSQPSVAERV